MGKRGRDSLCARATHEFTCTRALWPINKGEQTVELFRGQTAKMTGTWDAALHPNGAGGAFLRVAAGPGSSTKTPSFPGFILIISVMLLVLVQPVSSHPQCLDFEPPFKPLWHLEFCTQYEQFGCCDQKTDNRIAERYWDIIDQLEVAGYELCADMLKEVMCQVNIFQLWSFEEAIVINGY